MAGPVKDASRPEAAPAVAAACPIIPPAAENQLPLSPGQLLALQPVVGNRAASLYIARTRAVLARFPSPETTDVGQPLATTIPAGGIPVDKIGVVGWKESAQTSKLALHSSPDDTQQNILTYFDFGTRLQVVKSFPGTGWSYVSTTGGLTGYTKTAHVLTDLPEPGARLHLVESGKAGYAIEIARQYFPGAHWGADERFYVNVIAWANHVHVTDRSDGWKDVHFNAGRRIWVPSPEFALTLRGKVNSGSLSYEMLDALGLAGFVSRIAELLRDFSTAIDKSKRYMGEAIERHVDEAIVGVIGGLATMMVGAIAVLAVSTAVGAGLGALFGGVGAAPGAAIGAEVGTALLEWLGLGFLVKWILDAVTSVVSAFATFVSSVLDARGNQKKLDLAGKDFAEAIGTLMGTTIEALVAWLAAEGLEAGMTKLRESSFGQKLSGKFFDWLRNRGGGKPRKRLEDGERARRERGNEQRRKQQELDAERKRSEDEERARKERDLEQERRRQEEDRQREQARGHEDEQRKREAERQREREEEEKRYRDAETKRRKQQAEQARQQAEQARQQAEQARRQAEQQGPQQHRQQSQQQQAEHGAPGKPEKSSRGGGGKPTDATEKATGGGARDPNVQPKLGLPSPAEDAVLQRYTEGLARLREKREIYERMKRSAKGAKELDRARAAYESAQRTLDLIEAEAVNAADSDLAWHLDPLVRERGTLETTQGLEASMAGRRIPCDAIKLAPKDLRGMDFAEIETAMGRHPDGWGVAPTPKGAGVPTARQRLWWEFPDGSQLIVDLPRELDRVHETGDRPHAELHGPAGERLDVQGIEVPEGSTPAHMTITDHFNRLRDFFARKRRGR